MKTQHKTIGTVAKKFASVVCLMSISGLACEYDQSGDDTYAKVAE